MLGAAVGPGVADAERRAGVEVVHRQRATTDALIGVRPTLDRQALAADRAATDAAAVDDVVGVVTAGVAGVAHIADVAALPDPPTGADQGSGLEVGHAVAVALAGTGITALGDDLIAVAAAVGGALHPAAGRGL